MKSRYDSNSAIERRFRKAVNMTASEIRAWLKTDESKNCGFTYEGERESVGRQSARKIIKMLEGGKPDYKHMQKVVGYVSRHLAQRPSGDVRDTKWAWSLKNWGHDPMKGRRYHGR